MQLIFHLGVGMALHLSKSIYDILIYMPYREVPLVTGEYYHVFNRGVAKMPTYNNAFDYQRFLKTLQYYQYQNVPCKLSRYLQLPLNDRQNIHESLLKEHELTIEILSYVLMPNHFHLLVKQATDNGISHFFTHVLNSYTKYINKKYNRVGPLYQGAFKAVHIEKDEQLLHTSRYIHLNPLTAHIVHEKTFLQYPWSSLQMYLNDSEQWIDTHTLLEFFPSKEKYVQFTLDQKAYAKELAAIKHLIIE